jgi:hypothetical protein
MTGKEQRQDAPGAVLSLERDKQFCHVRLHFMQHGKITAL